MEKELNFSVEKVGESIVVKLPSEVEDIKIKDDTDKEINIGKNVYDSYYKFENKSDALKYYESQLISCEKGVPVFEKQMEQISAEIKDRSIFEEIYKIKEKLNSKYTSKYKKLEEYLHKSIEYNTYKKQIEIRKRDSNSIKNIINKINTL